MDVNNVCMSLRIVATHTTAVKKQKNKRREMSKKTHKADLHNRKLVFDLIEFKSNKQPRWVLRY